MIQLVTVDNEDLAYHYALANIDEVFNQEKEFNELTKIFFYHLVHIF